MKEVTTTIKLTGEIISLKAATPEQVIDSYRLANETIKAWEAVKKQLQAIGQELVDEHGHVEHGGYMLRVSAVQRMNYDKTVLRQVFDEDTLDLFLEPSKSAIDKYLAEHLNDLGYASTQLRQAMVPVGNPYSVVKLERVKR